MKSDLKNNNEYHVYYNMITQYTWLRWKQDTWRLLSTFVVSVDCLFDNAHSSK